MGLWLHVAGEGAPGQRVATRVAREHFCSLRTCAIAEASIQPLPVQAQLVAEQCLLNRQEKTISFSWDVSFRDQLLALD